MGLSVGLVFGAALSFILEVKDSSVRSESELSLLTKLPVLISVPLIAELTRPDSWLTSSEPLFKKLQKRLGLSNSISVPD